MQTHFITLAILAAYAIASYLFASAWNRSMPSFDPNMDLGRKPFLNSRGTQVEAGTGALGMTMGGINSALENMTPGAAIAIAGIFASFLAFMISTTIVPSWFFGVPGVTILHKLLLYAIGLCWVWVACRSLAMASYLLVSRKFIVVGLVVVPIWFIGAWIQPSLVSSHQKFNECTLKKALLPGFDLLEDVGSQCTPPPETEVGADVTGTWSGEYGCSGISYGVKLVLSTAKNGSITGTSEISSGGNKGIFQIHGTAKLNNVHLVSDKWISGAKGLPALNVSAFHSHKEKRYLDGTQIRNNCSSFGVVKVTDSEIKAAEAKEIATANHLKKIIDISGGMLVTESTKASRALSGLSGTWTGGQICGSEKTAMRLLLRSNAEGHIDGVFLFHPILDESSEVPYGSYRVSGDINGTKVSLRAGTWILQPPGYFASDLSFELHKAPISSIAGAINLKVSGHSPAAPKGLIRNMVGNGNLTRSCDYVSLTNDAETIEWLRKYNQPSAENAHMGTPGISTDRSAPQTIPSDTSSSATVLQPNQPIASGTATPANIPEKNSSSRFATFRVTQRPSTVDADLNGACRAEFGDAFKLADWNDIRTQHQAGVPPDDIFKDGTVWVSRSGEMYFRGNRHYLVTRANHKRAQGFGAHDSIDNALFDLGSWRTPNPVLCIALSK